MIARISGKIIKKDVDSVLIEIGNMSYEVFLPQAILQRIDDHQYGNGNINLITYYYHQVEPSRSIPVLIGFLNEIEKEFFQQFITVSGIGSRAALRALNKPISSIARAIDKGDINFLKSLPGIGQQRAKEIIAKLQGKVGKFGLIQDSLVTHQQDTDKDNIAKDAMAVLIQLQYKKSEAKMMIDRALKEASNIKTGEELLNEIYKQKKETTDGRG